MLEPEFLSLAELLEIHQDQIARYGGEVGTRDLKLLESALGMPMATFGGQFLHPDLFEMASAYLYHIVQNHPFVDGNKRTGAVAANVFLMLNGFELAVSDAGLVETVLALACGKISKAELAVYVCQHSRRRKTDDAC